MLSFAEEAAAAAGGAGGDDEDWVATHTSGKGAPALHSILTIPQLTSCSLIITDGPTPSSAPIIGDIPDSEAPSLSAQLASTTLQDDGNKEEEEEEIPDMDDIPDMSDEEDEGLGGAGVVEEEDEAALKVDKVGEG